MARFSLSLSLVIPAAVAVGPAGAVVTPGAAPAAIQELPEGTMLSKENWEIAQGFLPDEILELYKRGDYANPIRKLEGKKARSRTHA